MLHYSAMDARSERVTIRELGHVALFVRDLDATRRFYRDILGLAETGTGKGGRIVYHIAFDVGAALDDLAAARRWAESHGLEPFGETPTSFSVRDPDGHEVELYVASAVRSANAG